MIDLDDYEDEDEDSDVILRNSARCMVCGDEIVSTHRHDFRTCSCGSLFVDGGNDYLRRGGDPALAVDTSIIAPDEPREHTLFHGPQLENVHHSLLCEGRSCPIHSPSDHPMREWPQDWDSRNKRVVRVCEHGSWHTDPDDLRAPCAPASCDNCCRKAGAY